MKHPFVTALALAFLLPHTAGAVTAPEELVRERTARITELIKANRDAYSKDHRKLYAMVDEQVLPYFDFRVMARSVLGRHWRDATADQRGRFTREFRELLVRTYATALLKYNDEEIVFLPFTARPDDQTAVVRTEVRRADGGPPIPIHYGFYRSEAGWKVYDVTVEGVSLVTNYRSAYAERIAKDGIEALIASLERSNREAQQGKADGAASGSAPSVSAAAPPKSAR
jgi:phospholipid transport system substrate-binding protein